MTAERMCPPNLSRTPAFADHDGRKRGLGVGMTSVEMSEHYALVPVNNLSLESQDPLARCAKNM
jgi:hypothetical protein